MEFQYEVIVGSNPYHRSAGLPHCTLMLRSSSFLYFFVLTAIFQVKFQKSIDFVFFGLLKFRWPSQVNSSAVKDATNILNGRLFGKNTEFWFDKIRCNRTKISIFIYKRKLITQVLFHIKFQNTVQESQNWRDKNIKKFLLRQLTRVLSFAMFKNVFYVYDIQMCYNAGTVRLYWTCNIETIRLLFQYHCVFFFVLF